MQFILVMALFSAAAIPVLSHDPLEKYEDLSSPFKSYNLYYFKILILRFFNVSSRKFILFEMYFFEIM